MYRINWVFISTDFEHSKELNQEGGKFTLPITKAGDISFLPISVLKKEKASFVDELESVLYVLMYFARTKLQFPNSDFEKVKQMKTTFWENEALSSKVSCPLMN